MDRGTARGRRENGDRLWWWRRDVGGRDGLRGLRKKSRVSDCIEENGEKKRSTDGGLDMARRQKGM